MELTVNIRSFKVVLAKSKLSSLISTLPSHFLYIFPIRQTSHHHQHHCSLPTITWTTPLVPPLQLLCALPPPGLCYTLLPLPRMCSSSAVQIPSITYNDTPTPAFKRSDQLFLVS